VTEHLPCKCKKLNSSPSTANPSPTKTKSTAQRHIELSLFLKCTVKQCIERVNTTECPLPEKVKDFKAYRSINCFLNSWEMWSLCSASSILAVCNLQWCFFPFFSQWYFIIYWKFLYVWVLSSTTLSLNKDLLVFYYMDF
jgi:hypothetical protein